MSSTRRKPQWNTRLVCMPLIGVWAPVQTLLLTGSAGPSRMPTACLLCQDPGAASIPPNQLWYVLWCYIYNAWLFGTRCWNVTTPLMSTFFLLHFSCSRTGYAVQTLRYRRGHSGSNSKGMVGFSFYLESFLETQSVPPPNTPLEAL